MDGEGKSYSEGKGERREKRGREKCCSVGMTVRGKRIPWE